MILSGVYCIECIETTKRYIGSTKNFYERWRDHKRRLRKGIHHCTELQQDFIKYGEIKFTFIVLHREENDLNYRELEQKEIDKTINKYNKKDIENKYIKTHTAETKQLLSEIAKSYIEENGSFKHTEQSKSRLSKTLKQRYSEGLHDVPFKLAPIVAVTRTFCTKYSSIKEAAEDLKISRSKITDVLRYHKAIKDGTTITNGRRSYRGYQFYYFE